MDEESKPERSDKVIKLSVQEYCEIERAMQWPEDIAKYDRVARPTNMSAIGGDL